MQIRSEVFAQSCQRSFFFFFLLLFIRTQSTLEHQISSSTQKLNNRRTCISSRKMRVCERQHTISNHKEFTNFISVRQCHVISSCYYPYSFMFHVVVGWPAFCHALINEYWLIDWVNSSANCCLHLERPVHSNAPAPVASRQRKDAT